MFTFCCWTKSPCLHRCPFRTNSNWNYRCIYLLVILRTINCVDDFRNIKQDAIPVTYLTHVIMNESFQCFVLLVTQKKQNVNTALTLFCFVVSWFVSPQSPALWRQSQRLSLQTRGTPSKAGHCQPALSVDLSLRTAREEQRDHEWSPGIEPFL